MEKFNNSQHRDLVNQFNLLNTINGGTISVVPRLIKKEDEYILVIKTPSISANNINLVLDKDEFIVFTWALNKEGKRDEYTPKVPCFVTTVPVPINADLENIDAYYKDEELKVYIPINLQRNIASRRQIKIHQQ